MKTIKLGTSKEQNIEAMKVYDEFKPMDGFVYADGSIEFYAIKISDNHAVLINREGRFIIAKRYRNCLSIGSGIVHEYNSMSEVKAEIDKIDAEREIIDQNY